MKTKHAVVLESNAGRIRTITISTYGRTTARLIANDRKLKGEKIVAIYVK